MNKFRAKYLRNYRQKNRVKKFKTDKVKPKKIEHNLLSIAGILGHLQQTHSLTDINGGLKYHEMLSLPFSPTRSSLKSQIYVSHFSFVTCIESCL